MALTRDAFVTFLPSFKATNPATVTSALARAAVTFDADVLGDKYETAVFYRAAHWLAAEPSGQGARLDPKAAGTGADTYKACLDDLLRGVARTPFVCGETGWLP